MNRLVAPVVSGVVMAMALTSSVPASGVADGTTGSSVARVGGWSGTQPAPVGLAVSGGDELTAVFTTLNVDGGLSVWVSDRPSEQVWQPPLQLTSGARASSVQFAENRAGAAVVGWDGYDVEGSTAMWVAIRSAAHAAWSEPVAVVSDSLSDHQPSVGIDSEGVVTVGYVHDVSGTTGAFTRRRVQGSWTEPFMQSTAPAVQMKLRVAESGYVTVAWSQEDVPDGAVSPAENPSLYVRQYVAPDDRWAASVRLDASVASDGLRDLVVNSADLAALITESVDDLGRKYLSLRRNRDGIGTDPCWPHCPTFWARNNIGDDPDLAVSVEESLEGETLVALRYEELDGSKSIRTLGTNGSDFGYANTVSAPGDVAQPQVARYGERVGISWITHTVDGDVLHVRGEWTPATDNQIPDPTLSDLGHTTAPPAMAVEPSGNLEVLWTNADTGDLQITTLSGNQMVAPRQAYNKTNKIPVHWSATTSASPVTRFDIRSRQATARRGFGAPATWLAASTKTSAHFTSLQGRTTCFSTRLRRSGLGVSAWSRERCTSVAVNDTSLRGRGWVTYKSHDYYAHTLRSSGRRGASLTLRRVRAKSIALLVSRRPNAGRVRITFNKQILAVVDTAGRRANKVIIPVATFPAGRRGNFTLKVTSSGRPVNIDGVFISAR